MAKIYVTNDKNQATVKAYKPERDYLADIKVHVVQREYESKEDVHWYYVKDAYSATTKLCWVEREYEADLKVWFVEREYEAGWVKGHPLQHRL